MLVGKKLFDFKVSALMPGLKIEENLSFHEYFENKIGVLFFYPLNFTFVCPTEILALNKRVKELEERGAAVLGISVDSVYAHLAWQEKEIGTLNFPLVSDIQRYVSKSLGVFESHTSLALRGTVILDKEKIIRYVGVHDSKIGRSVEEILRLVDAVEEIRKGVMCPVDWKKGQKAIKGT